MKLELLSHGFYKISERSAKSLTDHLPRPGYEKLVAVSQEVLTTRHGFAWLARTPHNGRMVWSIRDAYDYRPGTERKASEPYKPGA